MSILVQTDTASADNAFSTILITLMKGVVYREREQRLWSDLQRLRRQVQDYFSVVGLDLQIDDGEGYAYLRSRPVDEDDEQPLPRLIARRPLTFEDSLLLVLLRRQLAVFDATSTEVRLVVTTDEILGQMRTFLGESNDDAPLMRLVRGSITKVAKLGFLRELASPSPPGTWEVQRILKAFVDGQWLEALDEKLKAYRDHLSGETDLEGAGGHGNDGV